MEVMDEEDNFSYKMNEYMDTVGDGFMILAMFWFVPIMFVATIPLWLIGKVSQKMRAIK